MLGETVAALRVVVAGGAVAALLVLPVRAPIDRVAGPIDTGFDRPHRVDGTWLGVEGRARTCALRIDASVWCWDVGVQAPPEQIERFPGATMFATGGTTYHCGLVGGRVWCKGGVKPLRHPEVDEPIAIPEPAVAITGGLSSVCARGVSGTTYCWSAFRDAGPWHMPRRSGEAIESDPLIAELPPVQGLAITDETGCALIDGAAVCFGDLAFARHVPRSTSTSLDLAPPTHMSGHANAISVGRDQRCVAGDADITCALLLPTSLIDDRPRLITTHHAGRASAVAGSEGVTCAILDRRVSCWHGAAPAHDLGLTDIVAITVGDVESCALTSVGELRCWSWTP